MNDSAIEKEIIAKGLTAPRVTPQALEDAIVYELFFTAGQVDGLMNGRGQMPPGPLSLLTICVLQLKNGFTVLGKSACASPENFDAELGKKIARQDAVSQMWPLLG